MKAHSSRVPGKNYKELRGKPLFRWILDTLLELDFVDLVLINTDAQEELNTAGMPQSDRVILKARPAELRGDEVSMNRIIEHDIASHPASHYLMTHSTNPAISSATLRSAYDQYLAGLENGHDSLFGVNRHQTRFYDKDAQPINHDPDNLIPTQDLEPWYEENSCYYFFSPGSFANTNARIGRKPLMHETPGGENVDIDEWREWHLADAILGMKARGIT
jgi:CMP-N-acetylneuraminic acid synthetase